MKCEQCEDALIDYVHGELPDAESTAVASHLAQCSGCALSFCRLRADVQGIVSAYAEPPRPEVGAALRARVAAQVESGSNSAPSLWSRIRRFVLAPVPAYGVAVAAALPLVVWGASVLTEDPAAADSDPIELKPAVIRDYDATKPFRDPRIL